MMRKFALGTIAVMAASVAATDCQAAHAGEWEYAGVEHVGSLINHEDATSSHTWRHEYTPWGDSFGTGDYSRQFWEVWGGSGYSESKGRVRWKYRWKRGTVYQPDPNGGEGQWVTDPNDNPPAKLWLWVFVNAHASAFSGSDYYWARDPSMETAKANVDIESDPPDSLHVAGTDDISDDDYRTEATAKLTRIVGVVTNGQEEVFGPWGVIDAKGSLAGGRRYAHPYYTGYYADITGEVFSSASYGAPLIDFRLIEPNPVGEPLLGENEYTMSGGGAPFPILTRTAIGGSGVNAEVLAAIKSSSHWELSRSLSNQLPAVEHGYQYNSGTQPQSGAVFPRFRTDAPNDPDPADPSQGAIKDGLGFSTKNGLPASNGDFGARNVEYYFNTILHEVAPIEVFYAATAQTHPVGNSHFCAKDSYGAMIHWQNDYLLSSNPFKTATPNWFHYYSQAWSSPVPIAYDDAGFVKVVKDSQGNVIQTIDTGRSYYGHSDANHPGDNHLHISRDAHGLYNLPLYERRLAYIYVREVGSQKQYGIDNFVGTIIHEYTHKRCDEAIQSGMVDSDGDGVPNDWENAVGLNPNSTNSTDSDISDASEYKNIADQEVYCAMQARDATGPREADWADDGLNKGTVPGPDPANRNLKSYFYLP